MRPDEEGDLGERFRKLNLAVKPIVVSKTDFR
jgi:hypothetical protein